MLKARCERCRTEILPWTGHGEIKATRTGATCETRSRWLCDGCIRMVWATIELAIAPADGSAEPDHG